ncbi:hypothetical protein KQ305_15290 [Synechococcus sp. CS-1332]|nr:hypothetical protein [Synechococcus sp. CS-1332]MCT0209069.1 hypothetical protein [Synechococcus sp. CS-1332]
MPAGETGQRHIEAAPEEMNRAAFAQEPGPELLEHPIRLEQGAPEALGRVRVVLVMNRVLLEGALAGTVRQVVGSKGSLLTTSSPVGEQANMWVKVAPRSIQNRQPALVVATEKGRAW